ncbi:extracellular solute-binding protein [Streptomyces sp. DSM 42041]|uniref:Extracellular solute-binding protein n=1 Tax=Streptomyces hazeniae TaxID=3075538 RepID=A0ABU2NQW7_9ACTN|nr:extracellular solute-binding protein [Streptomyces sp. DSM 42041]MDT0379365.1 extracellular solute-binding protein [Streptomyces sp. DSM 42041]
MQRRRKIGLVAAGLATSLLATLTGCGGENPLGGEVSLKLMAVEHGDRSGNSSQRFWDKLIGEFRFEHPDIDVDVDLYERDAIDAEVRERVAEGRTPDLAQTSASFAGYARRDLLYNAREVLSTHTQASITASLVQAGSVGHVQYGFPFSASTRALFYNKDLFEQAGVEEPPRTWEELLRTARSLKAVGVKTPYGLPLGEEEAQAEALNWMLGNSGGYLSDAGSYDIDSPQNIATFEFLRDELVGPGLTNENPATTDRQEVYAAFLEGEVAMLNGHPGLMQLALENGIRFGTSPLPGRTAPARTTTGVADWTMAFKENGHAEEIRAFLDFVYQERYVVEYAGTHTMLPVTTEAAYTMREDAAHKPLWPFIESLDVARFYPLGKSSWGPASRRLNATIGSAVLGDGVPRTVLGRVQSDAVAAEAEAETEAAP